jgi:hypothetical protein
MFSPMYSFETLTRFPLAALIGGAALIAPAAAYPVALLSEPPGAVSAAADCRSVGEQVAAERGGRYGGARLVTQNGQPVCVVVVVIEGKNGERGRRIEVAVPAT